MEHQTQVARPRTPHWMAQPKVKANKQRQLELCFARSEIAEPLKRARRAATLQDIEDIFTDYWQWIEHAMTTEEHPWVSVVCAGACRSLRSMVA